MSRSQKSMGEILFNGYESLVGVHRVNITNLYLV